MYRQHDLGEEFKAVQQSIYLQVDDSLLGDLDRVNEDVVLKALHKLQKMVRVTFCFPLIQNV